MSFFLTERTEIILTRNIMRSKRIFGLLKIGVLLSLNFPSPSLAMDKNETITFIQDILHYEGWPTSISAFLCWDQRSLLSLSRTLAVPLSVSGKCARGEEMSLQQGSRTLFLLDADCPWMARQCLEEFDFAKLFRSPNKFLILKSLNSFAIPSTNSSLVLSRTEELSNTYCGSHPEANELTKTTNKGVGVKNGEVVWYESMLAQVNVLTDSDVNLAQKSDNGFEIIKVYRRRPRCLLIVENFGYWTRDAGITALRLTTPSLRRGNLMGTQLTASFVITDNDTLDHLQDYRNQHIDTITKVNYPLTSHLVDILNGSRRFVWTESWGYKNPAGEWNGMMGWLARKEADLGGTPLFFTLDRTEAIEYISMTTPSISKFIFRQPPLSYVSNIFILPFRWTVWVAACLLVMLSILVIFSIASWEDKKGQEDDESTTRLQGRWGDVCLMAIGAVAQQGSISEPKSFSGRMATVLMFVVLMFLYTSYSANIVSLLQSQSNSIRTLNDLLHSRMQLAVDDTVFFRHYFPIQTEPVRRAIWEQKVSSKGSKPKFLPMTDGIKEMRKGLFAFHVEIGVGYKVVSDTFREDEKCGLREITYLQLIDPWYAIQKNSPFKEMFKIGMRRLQESGLQSREVQRLYTKKPVCSGKGSSFVSVGLLEVLPALEWLMGCIGLSIGVFLLELLYSRYIPGLQQCFQGNKRFQEQ